jgi:predicted DNA binding CopG/RHH family protein
MARKLILDEFEQDIEDNFALQGDTKNVDHEMRMLMVAARSHMKRKKPITIRLSEADLEIMQIKASKLGIPYQTYINMVIHKDATSGI